VINRISQSICTLQATDIRSTEAAPDLADLGVAHFVQVLPRSQVHVDSLVLRVYFIMMFHPLASCSCYIILLIHLIPDYLLFLFWYLPWLLGSTMLGINAAWLHVEGVLFMSRLKNRRAKEAYHKFMCSSKCCHPSSQKPCCNPHTESNPHPPSFISRKNPPPRKSWSMCGGSQGCPH
jgi:hypothetical protein